MFFILADIFFIPSTGLEVTQAEGLTTMATQCECFNAYAAGYQHICLVTVSVSTSKSTKIN